MLFKTGTSFISDLRCKITLHQLVQSKVSMRNLLNSFLDLIYRKKCYFCGSSKHSFKMCPACYDKLEYLEFKPNRIVESTDIYCAGIYTKDLQKLIRGVKYHNQKELAYYQAKFMYEYFLKLECLQDKNFLIVPVPMHKNRERKRRYNHMDLVCEEFSKLSGFECCFDLIKRVKDTKPQYKLTRLERLDNLSQAFEVNPNLVVDKQILLIDDICTTGSTFEEMIKVLKKNGYCSITCFATSTPV